MIKKYGINCWISFFDIKELKRNINKNCLILDINAKVKKSDLLNVRSIILNISGNINNLNNKDKFNIIKKMQKIQKICNKKNIMFGTKIGKEKVVLNIQNKNYELDIKENEIIISVNAILYKNKEKKYIYLYKEICKQLDKKFAENNYCDFKNDICIAKKSITMGCCHYSRHKFLGIFLPNDFVLCKYQQNRQCKANCITCKLFTCDVLRKKHIKFNSKNIILISLFFNPLQKLIIRYSYFTEEKKIIKRILLLDLGGKLWKE